MNEEITEPVANDVSGRIGPRHRSPNYPLFDLQVAMVRARAFYKEAKRYAVDVDSAMRFIGYKSKSAIGGRAVATMLGYGLLDESKGKNGARNFMISDAAYRLIEVLPEDDPEHIALLQQAALKPRVFGQLAQQFSSDSGLPNELVVKRFLLDHLKFNPDSVSDVIKTFRETYEYAKLGDRGTLSVDETDKVVHDKPGDKPPPKNPPPAPGMPGTGGNYMPATGEAYSLPIPLSRGRFAVLQTPSDISPKEYDRIKSYLENNKEAILDDLYSDDDDEEGNEDSGAMRNGDR